MQNADNFFYKNRSSRFRVTLLQTLRHQFFFNFIYLRKINKPTFVVNTRLSLTGMLCTRSVFRRVKARHEKSGKTAHQSRPRRVDSKYTHFTLCTHVYYMVFPLGNSINFILTLVSKFCSGIV